MYGDDAWAALKWLLYGLAALAAVGVVAIIKWIFSDGP